MLSPALLGNNLAYFRREAGMTQKTATSRVNVLLPEPISERTLARAEQGRRPVTALELQALAEVYGVTIGQLFGEAVPEPKTAAGLINPARLAATAKLERAEREERILTSGWRAADCLDNFATGKVELPKKGQDTCPKWLDDTIIRAMRALEVIGHGDSMRDTLAEALGIPDGLAGELGLSQAFWETYASPLERQWPRPKSLAGRK